MARVGLTKLNTIKSLEDKVIEINGEQIAVHQTLPIKSKSELITKVMLDTLDSKNIISPIRQKVYSTIYILAYYTNINLTETMLVNIESTYDIIHRNGIDSAVFDAIPKDELNDLYKLIDSTLHEVTAYNLSFAGVLENIQSFQQKDEKSVNEILEQLKVISDNETLKDVLTKLG